MSKLNSSKQCKQWTWLFVPKVSEDALCCNKTCFLLVLKFINHQTVPFPFSKAPNLLLHRVPVAVVLRQGQQMGQLPFHELGNGPSGRLQWFRFLLYLCCSLLRLDLKRLSDVKKQVKFGGEQTGGSFLRRHGMAQHGAACSPNTVICQVEDVK